MSSSRSRASGRSVFIWGLSCAWLADMSQATNEKFPPQIKYIVGTEAVESDTASTACVPF